MSSLPAFINVEYQRDANGFPAFSADIKRSFDGAENSARKFSASVADIEKSVSRALAGPRNAGGALDLDVPGLKASAAAAEAKAAAMRELALAARLATTTSSATGQAASVEAAQFDRLAAEYGETALAARSMATTMEQVQTQLDRTAGAATRLNVSTPGMAMAMQSGAKEASRLRMATLGAGQQMQDLVIQIGSGQRVSTAFAQQLPQLGFAMSLLEGNSNRALGTLGRLGAIISGPLGIAVPLLAIALGPLIDNIFKIGEESGKAAGKVDDLTAALQALANAQANIGQVGLAEGKLNALREERLRISTELDTPNRKGRSGLQERNRARERLTELNAEIAALEQQVKWQEAVTRNNERIRATTPTRTHSGVTGRSTAGRRAYDPEAALGAFLFDQNRSITSDIGKWIDNEVKKLERLGSVGDQIAEQRARQREFEQADAERLLATYSQMLGLVQQVNGTTGAAASVLSGLMTGQFSGLGKAGTLLNLTAQSVGADGWKQVTDKLDQVFGDIGGDGTFARSMTDILAGAGIGATASSLILGGRGSGLGASIGGALGGKFGEKFLEGGLNKIFKGLGDFAGPIGSIAGGILGGLAGGLFKKTKKGSATIGADAFGNLSVLGVKGNSGSRKRAAEDSAEAVIGSLEGIAEQFGAVIDASLGSVSVGVRKKSYRVDPTGQGITKKKKGAIDFGQDAQAAAEYAMLDLIKDGVLVGLRKGTKTLLQDASDLQVGLSKALKFENVFRDLKRAKDPVGAAIDDLNREFQSLINIFKQAGATAEETAQLEELYGIRRKEAVEQAFDSVASALKDLMNEITIGDSGYSLRTRLANAQAAFNPLATRVQAGDSTAYDAFADASRQLMEISREFYGSGTEYFALLDQVKSITQGQLDYQQRLYDSATGGSALSFDVQPVVSATDQMRDELAAIMKAQLAASNDNSGQMIALMRQMVAGQNATIQPTGIAGRFNF